MNQPLEQQLEHSRQRANRYWYEDGLSDLALGLLFVLLGLLFGLEARAAPDSWIRGASALLLPILVLGGIYLGRWGVRKLKERVTYPRTGYVAYRQEGQRRATGWTVGIAVGIGVAIAVLFASGPLSMAWIPALQGLVIGLFLLYLASRMHVIRYYGLALASVVLGVAAALVTQEPVQGNALYYVVQGLLILAAGAWGLGAYLRRTQPGGEVPDG